MPQDYIDTASDIVALWRQNKRSEAVVRLGQLAGPVAAAVALQAAEQLEGSGMRTEFVRFVYKAGK